MSLTARRSIVISLGLFVCIPASWALLIRSSAREPAGSPSALRPRLDCDPSVDFGPLRPGTPASIALTVTNPTLERVALSKGDSSCPCISVQGVPLELEPGDRAELRIEFNPAENPEFRGKLAATVVGLAPRGENLFRCRVLVEVVGPEGTPSSAVHRTGVSVRHAGEGPRHDR